MMVASSFMTHETAACPVMIASSFMVDEWLMEINVPIFRSKFTHKTLQVVRRSQLDKNGSQSDKFGLSK